VRFACEHPERIPALGDGRDAKHVLVEAFALALYRALPDFDTLDADHDGHVSLGDVEQALARQSHEPPSPLVASLVLNAVDRDHDRQISRDEADAARARSPDPRRR
jgi:hypothetical protein